MYASNCLISPFLHLNSLPLPWHVQYPCHIYTELPTTTTNDKDYVWIVENTQIQRWLATRTVISSGDEAGNLRNRIPCPCFARAMSLERNPLLSISLSRSIQVAKQNTCGREYSRSPSSSPEPKFSSRVELSFIQIFSCNMSTKVHVSCDDRKPDT